MTTTTTTAPAAERRTYAWLVDGQITAGTLDDYAKDLDQGDLAGVAVGRELWTGDGMIRPTIVRSDYDDEDYAYVSITVQIDAAGNVDAASYREDGRM